MSTPKPLPEIIETTNIETQDKKKQRSIWLTLISLILAAIFLFFTLRNLDWGSFWSALRFGHYWFVLLILPLASLNYLIRAVRWRIFVRTDNNKVSLKSAFWANMVGYLGNAFLPARAGEIIRSAYLGKTSGLGTSLVLAVSLTERILDVIALVIIGSISLIVQKGLPSVFTQSVLMMALIGFIGLAFIIAAPYHQKLILRIINWFHLPEKINLIISTQIGRFIDGMRCLQNWRNLLGFLLLTVLIWFSDAFICTIGVGIISEKVTMSQALVLLSALGLSSAIPSTPGYIGVYQFVAVTVLVPFGFTKANALAYILVSQLLNTILVSFWGLIGLLKLKRIQGFDNK